MTDKRNWKAEVKHPNGNPETLYGYGIENAERTLRHVMRGEPGTEITFMFHVEHSHETLAALGVDP